jgi:hypothetical protein
MRSVSEPAYPSPEKRIGDYLDRFVTRCEADRKVQGVLLLGSAADPRKIDELSDLDLMVITTSPRRLSSPAWLESIEPPPLFSWTYQSPIGSQRVGQAIYEGPIVVDLAFVTTVQAFLLGLAVRGLARRPALRRLLPANVAAQIDA